MKQLALISFILSLCFVIASGCSSEDSPSVPDFEIFVSSRATSSVKRFDGSNGEYFDDFVKPGSGGLNLTQEVAFGPDNHLYVSGRGTSAILKFDKTSGEFIERFTKGYSLDEPTKITFGPDGLLYVSQWGKSKNKVARFEATSGAFVDEITEGLNQGMAHTWDNSGRLYVVSYGSRDVRRYSSEGVFIDVFTKGGSLQGPVNLWFGADGNLFVADWETGSVQIFDGSTGDFVRNFITGLAKVEGFAFDKDGNLYLCDWVKNTINQYDASGKFKKILIKNGSLSQPNGIAIRQN